MKKKVFIAATGQNVGKTTTSLGLISGLKKRVKSVGFIKPIGQDHVEIEEGIHVDKDVPLIKGQFDLKDPYQEMSPLLLPQGFTRDYLDGKIELSSLKEKILKAFQAISSRHEITIIEGTGHTGVGSIIDLSNAQVASLLNAPLLLIVPGGLGSSFDELALNYAGCQQYGVKIGGVILNRVLPDKKEMIDKYMEKALQKWNIPLLGSIPYTPFLSAPTMLDFAQLFKTKLLTCVEEELRHFHHIRIVASSLEIYRGEILPNQLIITPANRKEIILATLSKSWDRKIAGIGLESGMILTGKPAPDKEVMREIEQAGIPMLYVPLSSSLVMQMIHSFTAKIRRSDTTKIKEALHTVEPHINFDKLCEIF